MSPGRGLNPTPFVPGGLARSTLQSRWVTCDSGQGSRTFPLHSLDFPNLCVDVDFLFACFLTYSDAGNPVIEGDHLLASCIWDLEGGLVAPSGGCGRCR